MPVTRITAPPQKGHGRSREGIIRGGFISIPHFLRRRKPFFGKRIDFFGICAIILVGGKFSRAASCQRKDVPAFQRRLRLSFGLFSFLVRSTKEKIFFTRLRELFEKRLTFQNFVLYYKRTRLCFCSRDDRVVNRPVAFFAPSPDFLRKKG